MKKNRISKAKFKDYAQDQLMLIPPSLEDLIDKNHPVRIVNQVLNKIDLDPLLARYKGGGTSSYHPRMLLKVVVYAYLSNIYSSRKMEAALKENIHFMWIAGMSTPDHNTINRFRSERLKGVLKKVFGKVVELLVEQELVSLKEVYLDGTKLEANANRFTFVLGNAIKTRNARIKKQLEELWEYTQKIAQDELAATDYTALPPHIWEFKTLYTQMPETVTADAGYGSEENYQFLDENQITAYVKDTYKQLDCYYCPMGQPMRYIGQRKRIRENGFEQVYSIYQAINCQGCPMRGACNKQEGNRKIEVNHRLQAFIKQARTLLLSEQGIHHRKQRPVDVEPVFGISNRIKSSNDLCFVEKIKLKSKQDYSP